MPLVDSSAKWQSSLAMVERALRNKQPVARFLKLHPGAFPALTGEEWVAIGEIHKVLVDVNKCLANVQGDGKMLAQYVPHCNTLMQRLATRATAIALAYKHELEQAELRNIDDRPTVTVSVGKDRHPGRVWKSVHGLMKVAAFAHPRCRKGLFSG